MTTLRTILLSAVAAALLTTGCAGITPGSSPTGSPVATPTTVTTPDEAVLRVVAHEPRLTGIAPRRPTAIGQTSWYEAAPASGVGAFVVTMRVGWGDCEAGCINEHRWVYAVAPDGGVSVVSEDGAAVPDAAWPARAAVGRIGIGGKATAGPVCPVEKNPPDPACAPRPVAGAVIVIRTAAGVQVHRVTTGADGSFFGELPAGDYTVEPQAVEGLMGAPGPQQATVRPGAVTTIELRYDTGIR